MTGIEGMTRHGCPIVVAYSVDKVSIIYNIVVVAMIRFNLFGKTLRHAPTECHLSSRRVTRHLGLPCESMREFPIH